MFAPELSLSVQERSMLQKIRSPTLQRRMGVPDSKIFQAMSPIEMRPVGCRRYGRAVSSTDRPAGRVKSYVDNNGATLNKGEYCTQSEHVNMIIIINAYGSDKCALPGFVQKCPKRVVLGCVICASAAQTPAQLRARPFG